MGARSPRSWAVLHSLQEHYYAAESKVKYAELKTALIWDAASQEATLPTILQSMPSLSPTLGILYSLDSILLS